jgi:YVTN family beta-propeller protein
MTFFSPFPDPGGLMRSFRIIFWSVILFVTPVISFGGHALDKYLWVPNYYSNTVSKVDVNSHAVVATIPVGTKPAGIAVGINFVYVTCRRSSHIYRISKTTNAVYDSINLSTVMELPIGVAVDSAGYAFVVGREHFDPSVPDPAYLVKVNPQSVIDTSVSLLTIDPDPEDEAMRMIGIGLNGKGNGFVPWKRAYWVNTGVIQFNTDDLSFTNYPISYHYYRAPGVGIDKEGNGWTAGCRHIANFTKLVPERGLYSLLHAY